MNHKEDRMPKNWCLQTLVPEKTPESSLDCKEIKPILREIKPEYSLEGLRLKWKLQYFGHMMQTDNSLQKSLMLGSIKGRRRRGHQRMRWLDGLTDAMNVNSGKLWEMARDSEPSVLQSMGSQSRTWLGNWTTLINLLIWCHIGFRHTAMIQLCIYIYSEYLRIEVFELYFSNSLWMLGKWVPVRNTSVHSIADCLQLGAVSYKLALTKSIASNWTAKAFATCLCGVWTPCCHGCWPSTVPGGVQGQWGPLCSRESGGTGL